MSLDKREKYNKKSMIKIRRNKNASLMTKPVDSIMKLQIDDFINVSSVGRGGGWP